MSSNIVQILIYLKDRSKSIEQRAAEVAELLPSIGDTLNLRHNNIGAEGAKALSTALPMMTSLVTLDLRLNIIGDEGTKALSTALPMTLVTLDLSFNNIGAVGAKALSTALPMMISLVTLDLSWNSIGTVGAKALSTALPKMTSLVTLKFRNNSIGNDGVNASCDALSHNFSLVSFDLYSSDSTVQVLIESYLERNRLIAVDRQLREERWVRRRHLLLMTKTLSGSLPLIAADGSLIPVVTAMRTVILIQGIVRHVAAYL